MRALTLVVVVALACAGCTRGAPPTTTAPSVPRRDFADDVTCASVFSDDDAKALGAASVKRLGDGDGKDESAAFACSLDVHDASGATLASIETKRYLRAPASMTAGVFLATARDLSKSRPAVETDLASTHPELDELTGIEFSRGGSDSRTYALLVADRGLFVDIEISPSSPWWPAHAAKASAIVERMLGNVYARAGR